MPFSFQRTTDVRLGAPKRWPARRSHFLPRQQFSPKRDQRPLDPKHSLPQPMRLLLRARLRCPHRCPSRHRSRWQLSHLNLSFDLCGQGSFRKSGEPVFEMRLTENRIVARSEALVVQPNVVVKGTRISNPCPGIARFFQELADEFSLTDRIWTCRFDHAIQRCLKG